jgi:hypothetical protein
MNDERPSPAHPTELDPLPGDQGHAPGAGDTEEELDHTGGAAGISREVTEADYKYIREHAEPMSSDMNVAAAGRDTDDEDGESASEGMSGGVGTTGTKRGGPH